MKRTLEILDSTWAAYLTMAISVILVALLSSGCTAVKYLHTNKDGSSDSTTAGGLLITVDGLQTATADGSGYAHSTSVQKLTGDVQMVQALTSFVDSIGKLVVLSGGNTNALSHLTNLVAASPSPAVRNVQNLKMLR